MLPALYEERRTAHHAYLQAEKNLKLAIREKKDDMDTERKISKICENNVCAVLERITARKRELDKAAEQCSTQRDRINALQEIRTEFMQTIERCLHNTDRKPSNQYLYFDLEVIGWLVNELHQRNRDVDAAYEELVKK